MEKATGTGTIASFRGTDLAKPASFSFEYDKYSDKADASAVWPNDADVLANINDSNERTAKAKAYTANVKKFNDLYEKTVSFARENFIAAGIAAKMPADVVKGIAESQITETPEMAQAQAQLTALLNG